MLHSHLYNMQIQMMTPHSSACAVYSVLLHSTAFKNTLSFLIAAFVNIQGDRVECYRGVVYKITNNGEDLLEEHEYSYTSVYEDR